MAATPYDGSGRNSGLKLFIDGVEPDAYNKRRKAHRHDSDRLAGGSRPPIRQAEFPRQPRRSAILRPCAVGGREVGQVAGYARRGFLDAAGHQAGENGTPKNIASCSNRYYFALRDEPSRKLNAQLADVRRQEQALLESTPTAMVMQDLRKPRETFMLVRGQYDKHGEKVTAGVPESFSPLPAGAAANRLGLARWLVAADQPPDGPRDRQSLVADVFRDWTGEDFRGISARRANILRIPSCLIGSLASCVTAAGT